MRPCPIADKQMQHSSLTGQCYSTIHRSMLFLQQKCPLGTHIRVIRSEAISAMCSLSGKERQPFDHLLLHGDISSSLWGYFLKRCCYTMVQSWFFERHGGLEDVSFPWMWFNPWESYTLIPFAILLSI